MTRAAASRGAAVLVVVAGVLPLSAGTSTQQNPTAVFSAFGPHEVTLTACNRGGCSTITKTVMVLDPRPAVTSASAAVSTVEVGQYVPLNGAGTGQPPLVHTWRVFQGNTLIQELSGPSAWWPSAGLAPGLYTAVLRIANASGSADSLPVPMTVIAQKDLDFYTVPPCRALDTRYGSPLGTGTPKLLDFTGICGVPAGALAIAVNVTVPSPAIQGTVVLYPGNYPAMGTSTIHFVPGITRANNAVLPLATDGTTTLAALASLAAPGTVNLLIDVTGYFLPPQ
jgi:PKD repeat protein